MILFLSEALKTAAGSRSAAARDGMERLAPAQLPSFARNPSASPVDRDIWRSCVCRKARNSDSKAPWGDSLREFLCDYDFGKNRRFVSLEVPVAPNDPAEPPI